MPELIPGLELAERFCRGAIRPILEQRFPQLAYSAARIDFGSDVLGFDTPQSRDHGWGPRCTLCLREEDAASAAPVTRVLAEELPFESLGYSTHFEEHDRLMRPKDCRPIDHGIEVTTVGRFFTDYIGFDPRRGVTTTDWLTTPAQKLRTIRSGRIFDDGLGEL